MASTYKDSRATAAAKAAAKAAVANAVAAKSSGTSATTSSTTASTTKKTASQAARSAAQSAAANRTGTTSATNSSVPASVAYKTSRAAASKKTVSTSPANTGYSATAAANAAVNNAVAAKNNTSVAAPQTTSSGYTALGNYEDAEIRAAYPEAARELDAAKADFAKAQAENNQAKMQEAHARAEAARSYYGSKLGIGAYSGGTDGSQKIGTPQNTQANTWDMAFDTATADENYIDGVYVHPSDQTNLSARDLATMIALKKEYATASPERQAEINQEAEAMRAKYGYSLGAGGDSYRSVTLGENILPQVGLPSYEFDPAMVNQVYDKLNESTLQQLLAAYNNSRAQSEYDMSKIPALYQQQRNQTSADNERLKAAYREQAAASGIQAGNRSQANLAFANQLQNSLGQLNTAEANALNDARFALTQLYNNYQQQIASAVAQNDYQRAAALLQEYTKAKESAVDTALAQADYDMKVADFNRTTQLNNLNQQNLMREYNLNLANSLADIGSFGNLTQLGGLSTTDANALRRWYAIEKLGESYPLLRGWY